MLTALAFAALSLSQVQPGSIADQAQRPLWIIADEAATLAAVDRAPTAIAPSGPVDATFWLFLDDHDGYDTMAAAVTVDCAARTFVHHNFTGYRGSVFVGAAAAQDTSSQVVEPDTFYGAMIAHVCDPSPDSGRLADYENFQVAGSARAMRPPA
ncbi:MAG: hypothetical protein J0L52_10990 [Caulobacterales bacterium]|nr:hypothetical protein [Caulobacterales bacterium]